MIDPGVARAVSFGVCGVTLIAVATRAAGLSEALWATCGALLLVAAITFACVLANKLPVALLAGVSLAAVDLGPNLAVSGSLATLLWLRALRHEGIVVTPALIGAVLVVH